MNNTQDKRIEEIAQKVTDCFFDAGARVSKMHYDFVLEKLEAYGEQCKKEERDRILKIAEEVRVFADRDTPKARGVRYGMEMLVKQINNHEN